MNTPIQKMFGAFFKIFLFCGAAEAALSPGNVTTCGSITSGGTYTLTADVSNAGTCFTIDGAANVIFDGNGRTITAQTAFQIQNHATAVTLQNLVVSATQGVFFPVFLASSCDKASADGVMISDSHFLSGGISSGAGDSVGTLCHLTLEDNTFDSGGVKIDNYLYADLHLSGLEMRRNTFGGGIQIHNMNDVMMEDNDFRSYIYFFRGQNVVVRDNSIVSSTWPTDIGTVSIVTVRNVTNGLFENNYIESKVTDIQPSVWRFYELRDSTLRNNFVTKDPASASNDPDAGDLAYGLIFFRSSCMNNHIVGNTLVNRKYGNGFFTHYSNECCNADGVLDPDCNLRLDNPVGWRENCHIRNNTYDGNTIITAKGTALALGNNGDDSFGNTVRNNVLVGGVVSNSIEAPANLFLNNTIDGLGHSAIEILGGSAVVAHNNIFHTSGSSVLEIRGTLTGDYNLLYPTNAAVLADQPNSLSADPEFADISSADWLLRDYRLSLSSPAIDRSDPATLTTWGINWDRDLGLRPFDDPGHANFNGSAFDIGAYEFGATPNVAPTPTPLPTATPSDSGEPLDPTRGDDSGTRKVGVRSGGCSTSGGTGWLLFAYGLTAFVSRLRMSRSGRSVR